MLTIDILIAPLRIMITALGTGVLPPGNPADRLRSAQPHLEQIRQGSTTATREVARDWRGTGADGAIAAADRTHRTMAGVTDDSAAIAALIEDAGAKVKVAADQLGGLIDSFQRAASALGPTLFTPQGVAMILPVALEHIARGMQIVGRTQAELQSDTDRMMALARTTTPAEVGGLSTGPAKGGIPITLPDGSIAYAPDQRAATAVRAALSQQGVPYVWGGTTPDGFDCSGFTQWSYRQAGVELPRLAQDQDTAGYPVSQGDLRPGDLAVWDGHVAMYVGNDQLVEAGSPVGVSPLRTTNAGQGFQGFFRPR
ncbi:C40 family peptidase [Gordonia insulae]|uniref:Murein DD-endopeptidase MepS/Murein LD-carboxypeptidase n=1 Tax=Gordonia insulae TaxID=2420509 RepID=A0A3G8JJT7_9ACTN|nr:C40 family peptidase [Gordonia insulae]AZG44885.1 Murein DD-endopeptidase MepS/Murein LD-carboxypeptidase [Gordonia insulae]